MLLYVWNLHYSSLGNIACSVIHHIIVYLYYSPIYRPKVHLSENEQQIMLLISGFRASDLLLPFCGIFDTRYTGAAAA